MKKDLNVKEKNQFYKAVWRWHFYAGLFVTPFMLILAVTGMMMMYIGYFDGRDGENIKVSIPKDTVTLSINKQSDIALSSNPQSKLVEWIKASDANKVNVFRLVDTHKKQTLVAINPYTGEIINHWLRRQGLYDLTDSIHSDLLLGTLGDRILEIAAGFAIILIITGMYLWWPRNKKITLSLIPKLFSSTQGFWKEFHMTLGVYVSIFFLLFLLSGMAWTGVWGGKLFQTWSTFPAQKWDKIPLSDVTHASLNHSPSSGIPWAIEKTPLPASGSSKGTLGTLKGENINLTSINNLAQRIGFKGRYRISFPKGEKGVWTINQDTMNGDAKNPFADKTVHVDRYTGKVLAKITFDDYSIAGKTMAVSIPIHMGLVTIWNLIINTLICLSIIVLTISGVIVWWKRRPNNAGFRLCAPSEPTKLPHWKNAMAIMLFLSLFFPLVGISLIIVLALDIFILSKMPSIKQFFS
ncbi:PepSY-associated TM helix domain-containing protein [Sulfurospirillum arcachonense]|uniref:PepSY-associated TM helix domain-containing protein n=1 Tax=Sulfurospirillum arcachonense TaxID=57666 RepID=UPI000468A479|nr:PepSY domain-containing protein [Sulfurospirillum arcachonense]